MLIFAVDDEKLLLNTLQRRIQEAEPGAEIKAFSRTSDVLRSLTEGKMRPDVAFLDIEMPGMRGLELARRIKDASPDTQILFVTGYSEYAAEAYRLHARGYILKPVTAERIREELDLLKTERPLRNDSDRLTVRCFGYFEVFWKGEPLHFARSQTRELLAYLIDRRGSVCTAGEIIAALWEDESDPKHKGAYLRALTADLRQTLKGIGMEGLLIRKSRQWAIRPEYMNCDYFRFVQGDPDAVNAYHGEYMLQYSWAEMTGAQLSFSSNITG